MRTREQRRQQTAAAEQVYEEQMATYTQQKDHYRKSYSACLEGRGYIVK